MWELRPEQQKWWRLWGWLRHRKVRGKSAHPGIYMIQNPALIIVPRFKPQQGNISWERLPSLQLSDQFEHLSLYSSGWGSHGIAGATGSSRSWGPIIPSLGTIPQVLQSPWIQMRDFARPKLRERAMVEAQTEIPQNQNDHGLANNCDACTPHVTPDWERLVSHCPKARAPDRHRGGRCKWELISSYMSDLVWFSLHLLCLQLKAEHSWRAFNLI